MVSIHLKDLLFHAHHGVYEEEQRLGNRFVVNVHVHFLPNEPVIKHLKQTINYENLHSLVRDRMAKPTPLLETVVMELCNQVMEQYEEVQAVFVSLEKTNPPIQSLNGHVVVSYQLARDPEQMH